MIGDDARGIRRSDAVFDEETPFVVSAIKQARRDLDLLVTGAAAASVRTAVICPSLIYGIGKGLNPNSVQIRSWLRTRAHMGQFSLSAPV